MLGKPSHRLEKHLAEHGREARATVLEIAQHGMSMTHGAEGVVSNTTLILKTKLRVEPSGYPSFEIEQRFRYGQLAVPSPGMTVGVVFDPDDHDKIMLDETASYGIAGMPAVPGLSGGVGGRPPIDHAELMAKVQEAQRAAGGDPTKMAQLIREELGATGVVVDTSKLFGAAPTDPLDRLEQAQRLHEQGVLDDEEFAAQKKRILGES